MRTLLLALMLTLLATPVLAQVGQGLHGPHYNLNIIGVSKDKNPDMTGNNGHRIFVPLDTEGRLDGKVKIYFIAGEQFRVLDANGTDNDGATIEVPHGDPGTVCYDAYATALGRPGGSAHVYANVIFDETVDADLLYLDQVEFTATRGRGKPVRQNISNIFRVSGCIDTNGNEVCDAGDETFNNEWVFNLDELLSYWWDYTNDGLKLLQIRFYDCSIMAGTTTQFMTTAPAEPTSWGSVKATYK